MERFCLSNQTRVVINNSGNYRNKSLVSNRSLDVRQDNELVKVLEGKRYDVRRVSGSSLGLFFVFFFVLDFFLFLLGLFVCLFDL